MPSRYGRYTMNPPLDDAIKRQSPELNAVHYLGIKPWLCYREFDCNWLCPWHKSFIDDDAHHLWWAAHDRLTAEQQGMCLLTGKTKARIELAMRKTEMEGGDPAIWNRTISDPRRELCWDGEDCEWRNHLETMEPQYFSYVD